MHSNSRPLLRCVAPAALAALAIATASALAAPSPNSSKRGYAGGQNGGAAITSSNGMNVNWYYDWGRTPNANQRGEFVPMAWSGSSVTNAANYAELTSQSSEWILGFNEPERSNQANMTVARAIELWPQLMASGKKLVSPAVSDNAEGRAWITDFMDQIAINHYRVDAIAFHWYGDVRPATSYNGFLGRVDWYRNNLLDANGNKLPIWITEFGGVDFTGGADPVTQQMNDTFLAGALAGLDSRSYVQRYAWWNFDPENTLGGGTPYTPSQVGERYNGRSYYEADTVTLDGQEGDDTFYLYGGTMNNTATAKSVRFVDALSNFSEIQGDADWSITSSLRVRSGATLRKYGTNTISAAGITVENDGNLFGKAGTLQFGANTTITGAGLMKTESGSSLVFTSTSASTGVTIDNDIQFAAGAVRFLTGSHVANGDFNVTNANTTFQVDGTLTLNGAIIGAANLTKSGTGKLRLNAPSTYTGALTISGGNLEIANSTGAATGTGTLSIGTNARLTGDGIVGATTTINGTFAPSVTGSRFRAINFTAPLTLASTSTTQLDIGYTQADQIISTSTIALNGNLQMTPSLLPAPLTPIILLSGTSVSGQFKSVTGITQATSPTLGLAVTYTSNSVGVTQTLLGDFDIDGAVGFSDLLVLAQNYGLSSRSWASGDLSGDAIADFTDLLSLSQNYGSSLTGSSALLDASLDASTFATDWALAQSLVPEPSAIATAGLILCGLSRRRAFANAGKTQA